MSKAIKTLTHKLLVVLALLLPSMACLGQNTVTNIVMNSHSHDTVWITPGECYDIYDPGGLGDYYSNDTSILVIRSTTGLGFRLNGYAEVSDSLSFDSNGIDANSVWGEVDKYFPTGTAYIALTTDNDSNNSGFVFHITFFPTIHSLDTLWQTDTSMAITWQDTTAATRWIITYGTHIDSLRITTATTNQAILTGLERNAQCYLQIESNLSSGNCFIPSIYGIRMPHDPDTWLIQYHNTLLDHVGIHSRVEPREDTILLTPCLHIYDPGGRHPAFPDCLTDHDFATYGNQALALKGRYDLGSSKLHVTNGDVSGDYRGADSATIWSETGYLCFIYTTDSADNGEGFDLAALITPSIYQFTANPVTCSTATLTWADTSDATTWWIAYGEDERSLDTVTTTVRSYSLSNLVPDRQYVCYLWSNETLPACNAPIKRIFTTPCDSSVIIMPYNSITYRTLSANECYTILDPGGHNNYHYHSNQTMHLHSSMGVPIVLRGNAHIHPNDYLTIYDEGAWIWYYVDWSGDADPVEIHFPSGNLCIIFSSNGDTLTDSGFEFQVYLQTIGNIRADKMADASYRIRWTDQSSATQWTLWYGTDSDHMDSLTTDTTAVILQNLTGCTQYYVRIANNAGECFDTATYQFCVSAYPCNQLTTDMDTVYCAGDLIQFDIPHIDSTVIYCPNGLVLSEPPYIIPHADSSMSGSYIVQGISTEDCHYLISDTIRLYVHKSRQFDTRDTIVENQLPWSRFDTLFYTETDTVITLSHSPLSCDSIYNYHLRIYYNVADTLLYYACESELPVQYGDSLFYHEGEGTFLLPGSHGEDSLVTFILHVIPGSDTTIHDTITESQLPWYAFDTLFTDTVADYLYHLYNEAGCDSTIHYNLFIYWNGDHCDTILEFPNLVTPNGDGHNDRFVIKGLIENNCFKYNELTIYDRNGHQVYHRRNIATDSDWWDPAARRAPAGTYFYYFKAHGVTIHTQHTGVIEVLRDK